MLLIKIMNVGGTEEASHYDVEAYVNNRRIYLGPAGPHNRESGWIELVKLAMKEAEDCPRSLSETIGCCPVCFKDLGRS